MKTDNFRRWVPLLGVVYVTALVFSEAFGITSLNSTLKAIGGVIDLGGYSPVSAAELAAAVAAAAGVILKIKAELDKIKGPKPPAAVLILALLPSSVSAQEPAPTPKPAGVTVTLHGGAMQFAERGAPDRRDFVYRLTLTVPAPAGTTIFARADYTRTQDGGDLLDPKTFRSVEGFAGARKPIGANLDALAMAGVSWDRDANVTPADPRLYTVAGGLRLNVPGRGYAVAAIAHHGPVGGAAALGSIVLDLEASGAAAWFFDIAVPLEADRFRARPYTAKVGFSARLKGWKF